MILTSQCGRVISFIGRKVSYNSLNTYILSQKSGFYSDITLWENDTMDSEKD